MECKKVQIKNFRNIEEAELVFDPGINLLVGENAEGKTNLLEAIGFSAIGKSFRTNHEEDLIKFGAETAEISLDFCDSLREQNITVRMMPGRRRRIEHNHVKATRISDVVGLFRTVLFCPEHLALVKEGPGERRNFLDVALSQLYPVYLKSLQRYNQILKQRNQLIRDYEKDPVSFDSTIELWSAQLAKEAATIAFYREEYVRLANERVKEYFLEMTKGKEIPELIYEGSSKSDSYRDKEIVEKEYFALLSEHHDREIGAGCTLYGIHKDDIEILLNGKSARLFASQGQQRSLSLALKLAEGDLSARVSGEIPVFLFDDVFSELDKNRREYLSSKLSGKQVIITTCEPLGKVKGKCFLVKGGSYTEA